MTQGGNHLKRKIAKQKASHKAVVPIKKKPVYANKKNSRKYVRKGNPTAEIRRGCKGFKKCGDKSVTAYIGNNIEEIMATRVLQSGSAIAMKDIASKGKTRLLEINRNARTKKRDRIAQKLETVEHAIEKQEHGQ